ncbi:hypothetical protein FRB90_010906 [Tulasnella sp. 427]|nr:hypothetical protein FRB90_010906 [Tulasnella sp. 427]
MPPSDSRPSTPQGQSRFHTSHSGKLLLKLRAKASAHSLRSSPPTTESSSGWSPSPRTSEETLNELFFEEDASNSSSMITAVIRQRVRTSSRESPVPSAPSKLRPSGEEKADKHDHDHDEEEDSATDFEDDFEGSMQDASFATVKAPPPPAAPAKFEVKDVVIRNGMRVAPHPVWEVPYPVGFSCAALQSDDKTHDLVKALLPDRNSPSFTHFKHAPGMVLDLGLQYKLPFPDAHFDFIRMSFIALAVPEQKWRFLVKELRRVLKPNGVLEWIDEEPVFPISPSYSPTSTPPQLLHNDFHSLLHSRGLSNSIRVFPEELKALKGLFEMTRPKFDRFKVCLPNPGTEMVSRAGYEGGLMRGLAGSPASISSSGRAPVAGGKAGHHHAHSSSGSGSGLVRKGRELKRSLGGGSTSDAPAPAPAQEKVSFDGSAAGEKEKALPAIPLPHYVPQGLMIVAERTDERGQKFHENHLLPLTPEDVEVHAGRNSQVLLNSREAMWQTKSAGSGRSSSSAGGSSGREEFDGDLWRYECERWARLHLPVPTWYDSDEDGGHPSSSTTGGGAGSRIYGRRKAPRPLSMTVMMPPMGRKPTVARSIFVMTCKSL